MVISVYDPAVQAALDQPLAEGQQPFPSPEDWRDVWIYFLMLDRFNGALGSAPRTLPWDAPVSTFQGGTYNGVRDQLDYLRRLGVGALWLSPVLKNCQYEQHGTYDPHTYHGYGIQNFLEAEPRFASAPGSAEAELRALVDAAHARGMYVIFDIVLHHTGDVFEYEVNGTGNAQENGQDAPYTVYWRDQTGAAQPGWTDPPNPPPADAGVLPVEICYDRCFGRHGMYRYPQDAGADFQTLKGLFTDETDASGAYPVRDALIRAYQYAIAKYDVDGFRIDTLMYVSADFACQFGNAMREYALSIGKKNFFTYGEVASGDDVIARFIGRNAMQPGDLIGVDAALDFPLFNVLPEVVKGWQAPTALAGMYQNRQTIEHPVISSHGDASGYFVTFLDNHDQHNRFYGGDPAHQYDDQVPLGLACLFTLQGIPSVYYGTEQGLHGAGNVDAAVREALWGKPNAFDEANPFYVALQRIGAVRASQPALRYGRQYFRPISGDGVQFGISSTPSGVLAFSRILANREALVVANTSTATLWAGDVIVDAHLHSVGAAFGVAYSNKPAYTAPNPVVDKAGGAVVINEVDGSVTYGPARTIHVTLQPMEVQILIP